MLYLKIERNNECNDVDGFMLVYVGLCEQERYTYFARIHSIVYRLPVYTLCSTNAFELFS